jgi:hypothetical protein
LGVGEVGEVQCEPEPLPAVGEDEREFVVTEGAVLVGEPDAAVELRVAGQPFLDAGHPD